MQNAVPEIQHLAGLFNHSVTNFPEQTALILPNTSKVTYQQYGSFTTDAKQKLRFAGINHRHTVGLLSDKSIPTLAILQAVIQLNACYVPLNLHSPIHKNIQLFEQSGMHHIILGDAIWKSWESSIPVVQHELYINDELMMMISKKDVPPPAQDSLAYILHTSGSTGTPKGVMLQHQNAMAFLHWCNQTFQPDAESTFTSIAPLYFDLSILDVFLPLFAGSALLILDQQATTNPRLAIKAIADNQVSHIYATPTYYQLLAENGFLNIDIRLQEVLQAGEPINTTLLQKLMTANPQATFWNLYGPTETNVCAAYKIPKNPDKEQKVPIGTFVAGNSLKTTTENELLVSGPTVMKGYWADDTATNSAFETDSTGRKWYRTGDLVEQDENGNYVFIGRNDRMIKRRGMRIELDEIELALLQLPGIMACAAIFDQDKLVVFYKAENASISQLILRQHCMNTLEVYKLPDQFIKLNTIPQTATNKTNYRQLKQLL